MWAGGLGCLHRLSTKKMPPQTCSQANFIEIRDSYPLIKSPSLTLGCVMLTAEANWRGIWGREERMNLNANSIM